MSTRARAKEAPSHLTYCMYIKERGGMLARAHSKSARVACETPEGDCRLPDGAPTRLSFRLSFRATLQKETEGREGRDVGEEQVIKHQAVPIEESSESKGEARQVAGRRVVFGQVASRSCSPRRSRWRRQTLGLT